MAAEKPSRRNLTLSRRRFETLHIATLQGDVTLTITKVQGQQVSLSFSAPQDVGIYRSEGFRRPVHTPPPPGGEQIRCRVCNGLIVNRSPFTLVPCPNGHTTSTVPVKIGSDES